MNLENNLQPNASTLKNYSQNNLVNDLVEKRSFNWVALTTLLTLSVPVLYVIGRAYIEGYFNAYGISADFFPYSTQDYLFYALVGIFQTLYITFQSLNSEWKILVILGVLLAVGIFIYIELQNSEQPTKPKWFEKSPYIKKIFLSVITSTLLMSICYFVLTILLFLMLIPLSIGHVSGKYVAINQIKKDTNVCRSDMRKDISACIEIYKDETLLFTGRVIAVSTDYVAIAINGNAIVIPKSGLTFKTKALKMNKK